MWAQSIFKNLCFSVRECVVLSIKKKFISAFHYFPCELSAIIPRSEGISCIVKKDFTCCRTKPPQKKGVASSKTWFITYKKSECYRLNRRRRPSCVKKSVFCMQEGHVLECRRASSCLILGLSTNREGSDYRKIRTISVCKFTVPSSFVHCLLRVASSSSLLSKR